MPVQPIQPEEVIARKSVDLPDAVLEAFNELIIKHWDGHAATFKLKEVDALIRSKLGGKAVKSGWLDVEPIYRKAGWQVKFDGPAYCETYEAYYQFSR